MRSHDHALCLLTQNFAYLHSWFFSFKRFHLLLRAAFACCIAVCVQPPLVMGHSCFVIQRLQTFKRENAFWVFSKGVGRRGRGLMGVFHCPFTSTYIVITITIFHLPKFVLFLFSRCFASKLAVGTSSQQHFLYQA